MTDFHQSPAGEIGQALLDQLRTVVEWSREAFDGRTPPVPCDDNPLIPVAAATVARYRALAVGGDLQGARAPLLELVRSTADYLAQRDPAQLISTEGGSDRVSRILWNGLEALRIAAVALGPIAPEAAASALAGLGLRATAHGEVEEADLAWGGTPTDRMLPDPEDESSQDTTSTEKKMTDQETGEGSEDAVAEDSAAEAGEDPRIGFEQFLEVELRVARVTVAEAIPKANKLLRLEVDLGGETRQLVAGIAKHYQPEELVGRQVVVVANLEPAKLMGVESQGMVLAATDDGAPVLLRPDREVPVGSRVR